MQKDGSRSHNVTTESACRSLAPEGSSQGAGLPKEAAGFVSFLCLHGSTMEWQSNRPELLVAGWLRVVRRPSRHEWSSHDGAEAHAQVPAKGWCIPMGALRLRAHTHSLTEASCFFTRMKRRKHTHTHTHTYRGLTRSWWGERPLPQRLLPRPLLETS